MVAHRHRPIGVVTVTPPRRRLLPGWTADEGEPPRTIAGCDCCGRTVGEMVRGWSVRNGGMRWIVCSRCIDALKAPRRRWWPW